VNVALWAILAGCVVVFLVARHDGTRRRDDRLFTGAMRSEVYRRWGRKCAYRWPVVPHICGDGDHVDHQKAYSKGGKTEASNGSPLCGKVNTRKGATSNARYVATRSIPVVGHAWYLCRWLRAEVFNR
jgi:5-methylcytosine-specific restriction endonuclease McrA